MLGEQLRCVACRDYYHYGCLNMTSARFMANKPKLEKSWLCSVCSNVTARKVIKDDTPVRAAAAPPPPQVVQSEADMSVCDVSLHKLDDVARHIGLEELISKLESRLVAKVDDVLKEIHAVKAEFTRTTDFLSEQIVDLTKTVQAVTGRVVQLEQENERLKNELKAVSRVQRDSNTSGLQEVIEQLRSDLNDREQVTLLNDVEISGIPEYEAESCVHIVSAVASKLGISLDQREVVNAARVGPRRSTALPGESIPRPRPIIVSLARRALRDDFIRCSRVRRGTVTTADLGLPQHDVRRIYVNERMTKTNRKLFSLAREASRVHHWRFVWSREGRIQAKRDESSTVHRIRNEKDLRVFENISVSA